MSSFKEKFSFEQRKKYAKEVRAKYPDKLPIVIEKVKGSDLPDLPKEKFLVPCDFTVGQFLFTLRKQIKLRPDQSIYLFVGDKLPSTSDLLSNVYNKHKEADFMLYMKLSGQQMFGYF